MEKMTLEQLKHLYLPVMIIPGDPNTLTTATSKHHIHKVNPAAKRSNQPSSHAWRRQFLREVEAEKHEANSVS